MFGSVEFMVASSCFAEDGFLGVLESLVAAVVAAMTVAFVFLSHTWRCMKSPLWNKAQRGAAMEIETSDADSADNGPRMYRVLGLLTGAP